MRLTTSSFQNVEDSRVADRSVDDSTGVDRTLIRWMLSLTPTERLRVLQQAVNSLDQLRNGKIHQSKDRTVLPILRETLKES